MALARHRCGSLSQRLLGFCYHPGASGITEERKGQRMKAGKGSKSGGRLKKKAATGGRAKKKTTAKRPQKVVPTQVPSGWEAQDSASLLVGRHAAIRQRFIAAIKPDVVSVPLTPSAGAAPQSTNATIALTIAKAEARYAEILASLSPVEETIAKLSEPSSAHRNRPPPLAEMDVEEIKTIFIAIRAQAPVGPPASAVKEAPTKLDQIVDRVKAYADAYLIEAAKSAGKATGKAIPYAALCYLFVDQLSGLSNLITDWLNIIASFF